MRSLGLSFLSLILTLIVIGNAYYQKKQFYPSVVYITRSNPSMAVIYIQAFIIVLLIGKLMTKVFFGQLRAAEFEHLVERSWYAITETCLAFTVFRDDFNPKFVAFFTVLLFLKSFHWLAEDRVDYMERSPIISWMFHFRVLSLLAVLGFFDMKFVGDAYVSTVTKGASVQLVFGFEYAVLMTMVTNIAIKYMLHSIDLSTENPWENKAVFLLYTELVMGLIKVVLYVSFVGIMVKIYTLPLFAFRPMYYTMRNFKKAFNDVILSRRAIRNMNTLYPDATPEELQAADNVCIICREEMVTASKKLPCNHIFHAACLRSWFQRQQTCPTCRLDILRPGSNTNTRVPPAQQQPRAPPQPPQQPVVNVAPPVPGVNPFQLFAGMNPFQAPVWPQPPIPPQPANPAAQEAGNAQDRPQNVAGTTVPTTNGTVPRPSVNIPTNPPFPIPPFAFMPFIPMSTPNLSSLSTEELRRLEGTERENVEARLILLKNIQTLLDTSVVMMQQYCVAANKSGVFQDKSTPSTSQSQSNIVNKVLQPDVVSTTSSREAPETTVTESDNDELRRRRLQRFEAGEIQH